MSDNNVKMTFSIPQKSFKLFTLKDGKGNLKQTNARIQSYNGIAYLPIAESKEDLAYMIKTLFGERMYAMYFTKYLYTKKFIYQNAFIGGGKKIIISNQNKVKNEVYLHLRKLKTVPTYRYTDSKNLILDFTDQFRCILPKSAKFLAKPTIVPVSEYILPELILAFGVTNTNQERFAYLKKYQASYEKVALDMQHKTLIVDFKLETTDISMINQFLDISKRMPRKYKLNHRDLYSLSLLRFIARLYKGEYDTEDLYVKTLFEDFKDKNVIFVIRNNNFALTIDFNDLRKRKVAYDVFFMFLKTRIKLLINNSVGLESNEKIEADLIKDEEEFKEEHVIEKTTTDEEGNEKDITIEKTVTIKKDDKVIKEDGIVDTTEVLKQVKDTAALIQNQLLKNSLNKGESTDIKGILNQIKELAIEKQFIGDDDMIESADEMAEEPEDTPTFEEEEEENEKELLGEDEEENIYSDEEESPEDHYDDIPEDILEDEEGDPDILESPDLIEEGRTLTDEEKREILEELNRQQTPNKTPKQLRRIAEAEKKYKSIKLDDRSLEEILEDTKAVTIDAKPVEVSNVRDESIKSSTLKDMEDSYLAKTLQQDIVKVFKSLGNKDKTIPMHIIEFTKVDTSDNFNLKDTVVVKLEDINQKRHTIKVDVPKPDEDGFLFLGGNRKHLKKQTIPLPITKTKNDWVALCGNRNKVFMYRQGNVLNRRVTILKKLLTSYIREDKKATEYSIYYGDNSVTNGDYLTTLEYDDLAKTVHRIAMGKKNERVVFYFNQKEIRTEIKKKAFPYEFKTNKLPIGIDYQAGSVIDLDINKSNNSVVDYIVGYLHKKELVENIESVIKSIKAPSRRMYSRMNLLSRQVPVIVFLGALYGLKNVLLVHGDKYTFSVKKLKEDPRLFIKFRDGYLYYDEYPIMTSLLLNGLTEVDTESYMFDDFETIVPYVDYTFKAFKSRNIVKGWTAFKEFFVDHITEDILRMMKMPTDFLEIFLYANDLLADNSKSHITSMQNVRVRGYEVIPVILYQGLAREYAKFKQKTAGARATISLPQNEIISGLSKSMLLANYDTLNPVSELKTKAAATYKGIGGTNLSHAYNLERRSFNPDSMGTIALATTASALAGVNNSLTMNPRVLNTRGLIAPTKPEDYKDLSFSTMSSPEELAIPFMMKIDHPNRIGFASGQTKHILASMNSDAPLINTGLEKTIIYQCGNTFAGKAKKDGTVAEINEEVGMMVVNYKDGTREGFPIGATLNRNSNFFIEVQLKPNYNVGKSFKAGDILTYSEEFFKKVGNQLVLTQGTLARVAILEGYYTEEDGSLLTQTLSEKMGSHIVKRKQISFSSKSNLIEIKEIGERVKVGDYLMLFEDQKEEGERNEVLDMLEGVDEATVSMLTHHAPRSSVSGTITDMNVYWTVPIDEMSPSCAAFIKQYVARINKKIKAEEGKGNNKRSRLRSLTDVSVADRGRINGATVPDDGGILIEYFITYTHEQNAGDKSSVHSALKTVTCQVVPKGLEPYSESGPIDMGVGFISITNRMINSIYKAGFCGKILIDFGKMVSDEYLDK